MGDKDDNISIIETRKSKPLKNIKFAFEVNEMAWDLSGKQFFLTTGGGTVEVFSYEQMLKPGPAESARTLHAHTANCYCIEFSPSGEYFAVGGADALVSLWHLQELVCMRTFGRLEWPVRTVSFSHDSAFIASGSEDPQVDIADVETSRQVGSAPRFTEASCTCIARVRMQVHSSRLRHTSLKHAHNVHAPGPFHPLLGTDELGLVASHAPLARLRGRRQEQVGAGRGQFARLRLLVRRMARARIRHEREPIRTPTPIPINDQPHPPTTDARLCDSIS